jgi:hypothetical protein
MKQDTCAKLAQLAHQMMKAGRLLHNDPVDDRVKNAKHGLELMQASCLLLSWIKDNKKSCHCFTS